MNGRYYQRYVQSLQPVLNALEVEEVELEALFEGTGIDVGDLQIADKLISRIQELAFYRNLQSQLGRPGLAMAIGSKISPRAMGAVGFAEMACRTPREALELVKRYRCLSMPYMRWDTLVIGNEVVHRITDIDHMGKLQPFIMEMALAMLKRQTGELLGAEAQPTALSFCYENPGNTECYRECFGIEPQFNQRTTELRFPVAYLDCERHNYDPMIKASMEQLCQSMASRLIGEPDIVQEVHSILRASTNTLPGVEETARRFGLSPRTLRRRLQEQGTSYRMLLDQVRQERAQEYLSESDLAIKVIAERCGFCELHSFYSAFKRWTGSSPACYRKSTAG